VRTIHLESKRIDKQFGVSIPQLLCLSFLQEQVDCKATPKQLKLFLQLNASTVTGIIQRLLTKGLVIKMDNPSDKRAPFIVLSVAGERLLNNSPELMHEKLTRKLDKMTPERLEALRVSLSTIEDLMEIDEDSSLDQELPMIV
jgi:DNA-binding MarR family transcriptional regulator